MWSELGGGQGAGCRTATSAAPSPFFLLQLRVGVGDVALCGTHVMCAVWKKWGLSRPINK